jgi:cellular nucleic acid-binding protein
MAAVQVTTEGGMMNAGGSDQFDDADVEILVNGKGNEAVVMEVPVLAQMETTMQMIVQQQQQQQQRPIPQPKVLSKWMNRLLHPELRSKEDDVVIQSPEVIPLNDTFIQDFGRRVRQDEATYGITPLDIDRDIIDSDNDDDENDVTEIISKDVTTAIEKIAPTSTKKLSRKVKITNIKYTTTATRMEALLEEQFGSIEYMNLIMQPDTTKGDLNSGLAYVTFVESESANRCANELKMLEHRSVMVTLLTASTNNSNTSNHTSSGGNTASNRRYWSEVDLSIKCYACGQTGHMSYECTTTTTTTATTTTTDAAVKSSDGFQLVTPKMLGGKPRRPCPLCANRTDHSEIYQCPFRNVCFNCGIPGHISRDCTQQRKSYQQQQSKSMSSRTVCVICYALNHHTKYDCPWLTSHRHRNGIVPKVHPAISITAADATCATCGQKGHYLCQELKWFYGLKGVSCCNWYVYIFCCC